MTLTNLTEGKPKMHRSAVPALVEALPPPPRPGARRSHDGREDADATVTLVLDGRRWARVLAAVAVTLLVLNVVVHVLQYLHVERYSWSLNEMATRFDIDVEGSVPTWFSNLLLAFASIQLLAVARLERRRRGPLTLHWTALGLVFAGLSADEIAGFHNVEVLVSAERAAAVSDYFAIPWVIHGTIFVVLFGLVFARFLLRVPRPTALGLVRAGLVYVGGALGIEMLGAHFIVNLGIEHPAVSAILMVEEGMEMFGVILLVDTVFRHVRDEFPRVCVSLAGPRR
jgi:hypothetical protein